jgi:hypothetical protein
MDKDEILENAIGNMGGEAEHDTGLGKLNHIPGQQPALTEEEKASLAAFNKRSDTVLRLNREPKDIRDGWIPIDRGTLGIRSQFYPEEYEFRVKPATVEAIKNWSSINEENLAVTNGVFNEIIKSCVSIYNTSTEQFVSWGKINSWDRFWFILKVREYTFVKGESVLRFDDECDNCGADLLFELKSDQLYYEFPDQEVIDNCWNSEGRYWDIKPREYDVEHPALKLYTPTLDKDEAILQWGYAMNQAGKKLSEPFLRFLPWLLERAPKDSALLDKKIKECKREFDSWDVDMFGFMEDVLRNITINPSEKLSQKCPHCGEEVKAAVRFPNGIRSIFAMENKHRKFGTK